MGLLQIVFSCIGCMTHKKPTSNVFHLVIHAFSQWHLSRTYCQRVPDRDRDRVRGRECEGERRQLYVLLQVILKPNQIAFFTQIRFVFLIGFARNICQHFTMNLYGNGLLRTSAVYIACIQRVYSCTFSGNCSNMRHSQFIHKFIIYNYAKSCKVGNFSFVSITAFPPNHFLPFPLPHPC